MASIIEFAQRVRNDAYQVIRCSNRKVGLRECSLRLEAIRVAYRRQVHARIWLDIPGIREMFDSKSDIVVGSPNRIGSNLNSDSKVTAELKARRKRFVFVLESRREITWAHAGIDVPTG